MARATDRLEPAAPTGGDLWFRQHVLTRFFASVWWVVMVFVTACVAISLVNLALDPTLRRLISTAIGGVIFIPIWREWPDWRRMARMLRRGT